MKDFTTPEYITPVINEIFENYKPIRGNSAALKSLNAIGLLKKKKGREYIAIRTPGAGGFYYFSGKAIKALLKELDSWTAAAETEPGELDTWKYREENRIQEAIRAGIIKKLTV